MVIKAPKAKSADECERLEQLPNIGPSLAADLRRIGIERPSDLRGQDAYALYRRLCEATGQRQDPVRARHLHGRHRLHARRRRSALVGLHGAAQGDLRPALSPAPRGLAGNRPAARRLFAAFAAHLRRRTIGSAGSRRHRRRRSCFALSFPALCHDPPTLAGVRPLAAAPSQASHRFRPKRSCARLVVAPRATGSPRAAGVSRASTCRRRSASAAGSRRSPPPASTSPTRCSTSTPSRPAPRSTGSRSTARCTSSGTCAARSSAWSRCATTRPRPSAALAELDRHFAKRSALARWRDASGAGARARALTLRRQRRPAAARRGSRILPSSTPLWRSSAYVVVTWKKKFGSAKCLRYASPRHRDRRRRGAAPRSPSRRCRRSAPPAPTAGSRSSCGRAGAGRRASSRRRRTPAPRCRRGGRRRTWRRRRRSGSASASGSMSGARRAVEVDRRLELLRRRVRLGLVEPGDEVAEHADEDRHARRMHRRGPSRVLAAVKDAIVAAGRRPCTMGRSGRARDAAHDSDAREHHHPRRLPGCRAQAEVRIDPRAPQHQGLHQHRQGPRPALGARARRRRAGADPRAQPVPAPAAREAARSSS